MADPLDLRQVGAHAVRAEVGDVRSALALAAWARGARVAATEVVPAATTVLFDGVTDAAAVSELLATWPGDLGPATGGDLVEIATFLRRTGPRRRRGALGGRRSTTSSTGTRPPTSSRRSAASLRASPTSPACPPSWPSRADRRPATRGRSRFGGPGRHVVRHLPDRLAGRLAADRPHRRSACGTPTRDAPALLPPGTRVGSCRHDSRRLDRRSADHGAGPRPARVGTPGRAPGRRSRPARRRPRQPARRQRPECGAARDHVLRADAATPAGPWCRRHRRPCEVRVDGRAVRVAEPVSVPRVAGGRSGPADRRACAPTSRSPAASTSSPSSGRGRPTPSPGSGRPRRAPASVLPVVSSDRSPAGVHVDPRRPSGDRPLRLLPGPRGDWFAADVLAALCATTYAVAPDIEPDRAAARGPAARASRRGRAAQRGHGAGRRPGAAGRAARGVPGRPSGDGRLSGRAVVDAETCGQCAQLRPGDEVRCTRDRRLDGRQARARGRPRRRSAPARAGSRRSRSAPSPRPGPSPTPSRGPSRRARRPCRAPTPAPRGLGSGRSPAPPRRPRVSPNRSSWIQSASPETPTPSSRTPPEVSRSASSARASRPIVDGAVGGGGQGAWSGSGW